MAAPSRKSSPNGNPRDGRSGHAFMLFAELQIGQKFTTDLRLLDIYWMKTKPVLVGAGIVNAISNSGYFVFFSDTEPVLLRS